MVVAIVIVAALSSPPRAAGQAWIAQGDDRLREAIERLVDTDPLQIPILAWPIPREDLAAALSQLRTEIDGGARSLTAGQASALREVERAVGRPERSWWVAAGEATELRGFTDAPRDHAETGMRIPWKGASGFSGELIARVSTTARDAHALRADGSYLALRAGNWIWSGGFLDRWWGGGRYGSLQLSNNARPVFSLALDRATSAPFESRWLRWLGPWTLGTFFGALERDRPDSDGALLWGLRGAIRPLPGLEFSITRNAQFCGDKPPCGLDAFWDVFTGNDNAGENVAAADEPGNQLATYELRWAGHAGPLPLSIYLQHTGETIDNRFPRPLRSLDLLSLSTWGETNAGDRWRVHLEASTTTCSDFESTVSADCGYENGVFTAGYRYRGRVLGHSTDSDSRQYAAGLEFATLQNWRFAATLRRAEINRVGRVPQIYHLLSPGGPELRWIGEGSISGRVGGGLIEATLGLERRTGSSFDSAELEPKGFLRWTQRY